ncbi:SslE/AcfD family lipoprotein zinc metalloprotease [Escherichia coli]|uniref:SslE/AcfD family lipoprotein zinc metalloprotease n=1 Tax=Escherichia coli TaxID=562 RepID=UPI002410D4F4|nr:SslE/AcfD family lipoprotein zinc metalloprotease [Escherichia coli]MDG3018272.1 SslE/AcfD family lipoprotein zinc metalloprotease [Escherichia coli]
MNKKFKYKKSLLAAILSATLLAGCDGGGSGSSSDTPPVDSGTGSLPEVKPDPTPNPEPTPEPTPDPEPTPEPIPDPEPTPEPEPEPVPTKTGYLTLGGSQRVTGATCNGESSDGFTFKPGEDVTCVAGNTTIATFNTQSEAARSLRAVEKVSFSLEDAQELAGSDDKKSNAVSLVTSSNSCPANTEQVCLTFSSVIESKRFDSLYKQIDLAPEEFKKLVNEEVENNAATDKAPSTHTSPVVPVTTPGTKPDLNASFVSANAEQFYQYQPTEIILSEGRLVDSQGYGVAGVNYYTNSGRGVTGENGEFSFSWGETISFGIDTFELGSVRGNKPKLTQQDVTDLIAYLNKGGSVLIMENVMSNLKEESASGFVRLLDAAGLSMALNKSVVNNDPQGYPNRVRQQRATGIWVYERYPAVDGALPYTIDSKTGEVKWKYQVENKPDDKPKLEVASWLEDVDGKQETRYAFIDEADHKTEDSLKAAKEKIFAAFPGLKECTNPAYHYEVNCLEYRPGTGVPVTGGMYVPQYTQLSLNADTAKAMVQAADLGTNIQRLYQHELYFRTNGRKGERLSSVDLERLYQNMSVWLWNDTSYRYEEGKNDELGFKTFTEFLNCYANDAYAGGTKCSADLKKSLVDNNMIYGDGSSKAGMMNPSYPLNYMEKPLTRLMLGRSWWDLNIKVDVEKYPGAVSEEGQNVTETISLYSNPTKWFAGNMQSTGLWAPAQKEVTIKSNANVPVTVTVALADDLTGREKHEVALNRPPRVTKTYSLDASGTVKFKVPYGGLIYIKGNSSTNESASFTFTGVVKAPFYKDGAWKNDLNSPAPLGELESDAFVYTTPKKNLNASNYTGGLEQFANDLDTFASSMNDFYGRDSEDGKHRMFTYKNLPGHKHRFTNDVQISIGDAHSGYPVMNSSFSPNSTTLPTTPLNDWLIWHEVGHNAAETPLTVPGATEVANNVLALYMQDRYLGKMNRVADDITVAPEYLEESNNQAWARGGAGDRLLMYAQLKEWAEKNFDIKKWYPDGTPLPEFYSEREGMKGWNLFQLMHRKARGDEVSNDKFGGKNYCAESNGNAADTLMLCASWVAQTDLSEFFKKWNPGANAYQLPGASEMSFEGGVSQSAYNTLASLDLPKPEQGPETINQVTEHKMSAE